MLYYLSFSERPSLKQTSVKKWITNNDSILIHLGFFLVTHASRALLPSSKKWRPHNYRPYIDDLHFAGKHISSVKWRKHSSPRGLKEKTWMKQASCWPENLSSVPKTQTVTQFQ